MKGKEKKIGSWIFEILKILQKQKTSVFQDKRIGRPTYQHGLIPRSTHNYNTRHLDNAETIYSRINVAKNYIFPYGINK